MLSHRECDHSSDHFSPLVEQILNQQLDIFLEALRRHDNVIIQQMCEIQPFRDWICGYPVNIGTVLLPKTKTIAFDVLVKLFKNVLASLNTVAIDLMWQKNSALKAYAYGMAGDVGEELEKISDDAIISFFQSVIASKQYWLIETIWYGNRKLHNAIKTLDEEKAIKLILKVGQINGTHPFFISYLNWLDNPMLLIKLLAKHAYASELTIAQYNTLLKCKQTILIWLGQTQTISRYKQLIINFLLTLLYGSEAKVNEMWFKNGTLQLLLTGNKIYNQTRSLFWNIEPEELLDFFMIAIASKKFFSCILMWQNNLTLQLFVRKFGTGVNPAYHLLIETMALFNSFPVEMVYALLDSLIININNGQAIDAALQLITEKYPQPQLMPSYFGGLQKKLLKQRYHLRTENTSGLSRLPICPQNCKKTTMLSTPPLQPAAQQGLALYGFFDPITEVSGTTVSCSDQLMLDGSEKENQNDFDISKILEEKGLNLNDDQIFPDDLGVKLK